MGYQYDNIFQFQYETRLPLWELETLEGSLLAISPPIILSQYLSVSRALAEPPDELTGLIDETNPLLSDAEDHRKSMYQKMVASN